MANFLMLTSDKLLPTKDGKLDIQGVNISESIAVLPVGVDEFFGLERNITLFIVPTSQEDFESLQNTIISFECYFNEELVRSYKHEYKGEGLINVEFSDIRENAIPVKPNGVLKIVAKVDYQVVSTSEFNIIEDPNTSAYYTSYAQLQKSAVAGPDHSEIDLPSMIASAFNEITLVDQYITSENLRLLLSKLPNKNLTIKVLTSPELKKDYRFQTNPLENDYPNVEVKFSEDIHDRFLILNKDVFYFGYSFKDLNSWRYSYFSEIRNAHDHHTIHKLINDTWTKAQSL